MAVKDVASALLEEVRQMKKLNESIMAYCTDECGKCPINEMCDWRQSLIDGRIEDIDILEAFVTAAYEQDERSENEA